VKGRTPETPGRGGLVLWLLAPFLAVGDGCTPSAPGGRAGTGLAENAPGGEKASAGADEEWFRLLLNGQPAGFARQREEPTPTGGTATSTFQRIVVSRDTDTIAMEVESLVEETASGELVKFRMVQRMAATDEVTEGVVRGDRMAITARGLGNPRQAETPYDRRAIGPHRLNQLFLEKLRKPGDSESRITFYPEKTSCGSATATLVGEEALPFPDGPRKLLHRAIRCEILPGTSIDEWYDAEGKVWKTSMVLPAMNIETWRSTSQEILREKYASPPEVFFSASIRPDKPLANPAAGEEVVYRFTLKSGDFKSLGIDGLFRAAGQTVVREDSPSSRTVRIARVAPAASLRRPVAAPPGEEESLAPSIYIQSDDPLIISLARDAVGSRTDAFEAARSLELWVKQNVEFKDLKTLFASAKEVAEKRVGDCTEHSVLLAALARAAGIPARVVSGLVWYRSSFVGHMWTEVWIDRWIPLDGTRPRGGAGPDHIAITESSLGTSSASAMFFDMVQVIGNLRIEVLEER
jgi:transglutaminase superfamily protein